jgi:hypothetical protein
VSCLKEFFNSQFICLKIKAKTHEIIGRLTRDGIDLISIENSLSNINFQLELRQTLLEKSKKFFKSLKKFDEKINDAFDSDSSNEEIREDISDLSKESFNNGKELLKQINQMANDKHTNMRQSAERASDEVERLLDTLNDKKLKFQNKWQDHRMKTDMELKIKNLKEKIKRVIYSRL